MSILKHVLRNVLDAGDDGGGGNPPADPPPADVPPADVPPEKIGALDPPPGQEPISLNVETFLTQFDKEDHERASKYASNYTNEKGELDVAKMMKSGFNLESKFGAFTGAPDSYEIATPEYLEGDVDLTDPYLVEFMEEAKAANMSQEGFAKIMDIHLRASIAPPVDGAKLAEEVGPEFEAMRSNMASFYSSRLSDDSYKGMQGMIKSKEDFELFNEIMKAAKPTKMDDQVRENFNHAELKSQMDAEYLAEDKYGNPKMRDPTYAKSWRERWEPFINKSDI